MPEIIAARYTVEIHVQTEEERAAVRAALDADGNILPRLERALWAVLDFNDVALDAIEVNAEEDDF